MNNNLGSAQPLIPRNLRANTGTAFPQQGSVDWVAAGCGSFSFTVEAISRLSKAGIEALTVYAARSIFLQVKLGPLGQLRIENALSNLRPFASMNSALWFGFGIKHIVRNLSESAEGLACIGICACLGEEYSTGISSRILQELFLLYKPPADLTPALHQWRSLMEACNGVVAATEFGLILSSLSQLCLRAGHSNIRECSKPDAIAKVLKGLFDISNGTLDKIYIVGGVDCAWLAAVTHWLLELSIQVQDESSNILYRPGTTNTLPTSEPQVVLCYEADRSESSAIVQQCYYIPSGRLIFIDNNVPEMSTITHGRLKWTSCLTGVLGQPMKDLLTTKAAQVGICLGAAARILELMACCENLDVLGISVEYHDRWRGTHPPRGRSSYGRGLFLSARKKLPELLDNPILLANMESMLEASPRSALREYSEAMNSLQRMCECRFCQACISIGSSPQSNVSEHIKRERFCSILLFETVCTLLRWLSQVVVPPELDLYPTHCGLERQYWSLAQSKLNRGIGEDKKYDALQELLIWIPRLSTSRAQCLYTGRIDERVNRGVAHGDASAVTTDGLCFYLGSLVEVSMDPERMNLAYVVPGRIEWRDFIYQRVQDDADRFLSPQVRPSYVQAAARISDYDNLKDATSSELQAKLSIEEVAWDSRIIVAVWHVAYKSNRGFFVIGPRLINFYLSEAHFAKDCEGSNACEGKTLNGFTTVVAEGEGYLNYSHVQMSKGEPIIRPIGNNPLAVWIALLQRSVEGDEHSASSTLSGSTRIRARRVMFRYVLQGRQCIRCLVLNAHSQSKLAEDRFPICILST